MTALDTRTVSGIGRLRLAITGAVQGVGFRPFVHRLASELRLGGWISNSPQGVMLEAEGPAPALESFQQRLQSEPPSHAVIQSLEVSRIPPVGSTTFEIRASSGSGSKTAVVLPDIATCPQCLDEIFDPSNRRFRYPFTNCTHCGPRFSIIEALPYDRVRTSMKHFEMCPGCRAEYDDPRDRRFHAQPNACPICGPQLELWVGANGKSLSRGDDALIQAAAAIREGKIVAVKGIGGFHLFVDARNEEAVRTLRLRKGREEKPFALLFPSLEEVKRHCMVSPLEERLLTSAESPIVLLKAAAAQGGIAPMTLAPAAPGVAAPRSAAIAASVAPRNPLLGVMLPSNPIHHLLMAELGMPVVATSGNRSDEPICTEEREAVARLRGIADLLLVHDRPIVRHLDDSIVRIVMGREMLLRRARGYAPMPIRLPARFGSQEPVLALGAHLKSAVALATGGQVFLSQHIGDLETEQANHAFCQVSRDLPALYGARPAKIVTDLHPDYASTRLGNELAGSAAIPVQHHIAHVLSCVAENDVPLPALGVAWDGTGCGTDGEIWGGEFFMVTDTDVVRVARLRRFRLPGGDAAAREPRRAALGLLYELLGDRVLERLDLASIRAFSLRERMTLRPMLQRGLSSPWCCSMGRLFDGVASILGVRQRRQYEGEAAMALEFAADAAGCGQTYLLPLITTGAPAVLDWAPMLEGILEDVRQGSSIDEISARFHNTLAEAVVRVAEEFECRRVVLSGGCFQNRHLSERTLERLRAHRFQPYWHRVVPPNDGGVALGQAVAAMRMVRLEKSTSTATS